MATKLKHQENAGGNVVAMPSRCSAEGCKTPTDKLNFCSEHYEWFKWGLITKDGKKPTDFDKKYQAYVKYKAA